MPGNDQYQIPRLPSTQAGYGFITPFGVMLPPGGRVAAYVRSTGLQNYDDPTIAANLVTTLATALQRVRSGLGDTIFVLPGHSESGVGTTMLANLVAGTRIIGIGRGSNMPVFRWTATTDNWALNKNDVIISGLRLRLEGANGVVEAITVTGADCLITNCDIETSSGASNLATTAINVSTGANRFEFRNNIVRGVAAGACTDILKVSAVVDQMAVTDSEMVAASGTATGLIDVTAAATNLKIFRNYLANVTAASTACIAFGNVACTGVVAENYCSVLNNGTAASQGITFGGAALLRAFNNQCSDEPAKSGVLAPVVVAT